MALIDTGIHQVEVALQVVAVNRAKLRECIKELNQELQEQKAL